MDFTELKAAMTQAPVLANPDVQQPFIVDIDASNVGVGAVLSKGVVGEERAVAYSNCPLNPAAVTWCLDQTRAAGSGPSPASFLNLPAW